LEVKIVWMFASKVENLLEGREDSVWKRVEKEMKREPLWKWELERAFIEE